MVRRSAGVAAALVVAIGLGVCFPAGASAEGVSDIPGAFVDVGIGARSMGMGGAVVVTSHGAGSLYWNPAGLAVGERSKEFSVDYADVMGLVPYTAASAAYRLSERYTLGIGLLYSGDDVLSETTVLLGAATSLSSLPWLDAGPTNVGATVRTRLASFGSPSGFEDDVSGSALGFGLDAGATIPVTERVTFGIAARDILSTLSWESTAGGSYNEGVPPALAFGVAARPHRNVLLELDLDKALHQDSRDLVLLGAEVTLFDVAALRGGYRKEISSGELSEFSVGAGANVAAGSSVIGLDIAYLFGHLEDTLRLSMGFGL
jgi:hypothetical protein